MQDNKQTAKHLELIYNQKLRSKKFLRIFKDQFANTLKENPAILLVIRLLIVANIGIWLTLFSVLQPIG